MQNKIEQAIDDLEVYINECKPKAFTPNIILVNKDEIEELIHNLRKTTPEEIRRVQQMLAQREAILAEAKRQAQELLDQATKQTTQLISEHQIMKGAYEQADQVVSTANSQAKQILDTAALQSNNMIEGAVAYTDELLQHIQLIINNSLASASQEYEIIIRDLSHYSELVASNRAELKSSQVTTGGIDEAESVEPLTGPIGDIPVNTGNKPDLDIV